MSGGVYSAVKKKKEMVHQQCVVELHFSNSRENPPLEISLADLLGKGPQHFLALLEESALAHVNFSEEQLQLLTLNFIFRGRLLNYNGVKFISQEAKQMRVVIIHVHLDYNYEKVCDSQIACMVRLRLVWCACCTALSDAKLALTFYPRRRHQTTIRDSV